MKTFYQCDVADGDTDSIWTGSIYHTETIEEAEFRTMLELQQDWGDGYMPDAFLDAFGSEPTLEALQERDDPEFPGAEAWKAAGYWDDIPATTGMLSLPPLEALAQLKKITFDVPGDVVDAVMRDEARLHVVVDMREPAAAEDPAPKFSPGDVVYIGKIGRTKTVVSADRSYGHERRYTLKGDDDALDEGWREDELELASEVAKGGE